MGGKFGDGFLSAAVSAGAADAGAFGFIDGDGPGAVAGRTAVAGAVGGTASVLGGGKFANGAYTAAFQHLLNYEAEKAYKKLVDSGVVAINLDGAKEAYAVPGSGKQGIDILEHARSNGGKGPLSKNVVLFDKNGDPVVVNGYYVSMTAHKIGGAFVDSSTVAYVAFATAGKNAEISSKRYGEMFLLKNSATGKSALAVYADSRGDNYEGVEISRGNFYFR